MRTYLLSPVIKQRQFHESYGVGLELDLQLRLEYQGFCQLRKLSNKPVAERERFVSNFVKNRESQLLFTPTASIARR